MDPDQIEKAEASIDAFIERRAREKRKADAIEAAWAESARRHGEKRQRELWDEWRGFHAHMRDLHASLAAEHEAKAEALLPKEGERMTEQKDRPTRAEGEGVRT